MSIRVTDEGVTREQKAALIRRTTETLVEVINKDPASIVVVIDKVATENWGIGGTPVEVRRESASG